jgi:hypothetical protein
MATTVLPSEIAPLVDTILASSRAQMTEGAVDAVVYVINSATGAKVPVQMHVPMEVSKDIAASMVGWTVKNLKADVTIMVTEAYTLSVQDANRYDQIVEQYGSIGEYPGTMDILMLEVQTADGWWMGRAPIEAKGKARRCGALTLLKGDARRSVNFLPEGEKLSIPPRPPVPRKPPTLLDIIAVALFRSMAGEKQPVATAAMTAIFPPKLSSLVDKVMALCRKQIAESSVSAVTYVIHSPTCTMVPVEMHLPHEVSKAVSEAMVRWTAKNVKADATVKVTEAWTLSPADSPNCQTILAEFGSIAEYPGKVDVLLLDVQTHAGCWMGRSVIETKGDARRCGPLEVTKADVGRTDFLSKDDMPG